MQNAVEKKIGPQDRLIIIVVVVFEIKQMKDLQKVHEKEYILKKKGHGFKILCAKINLCF